MIQTLKDAGYYIEDMGKEWGIEYADCYRWMNHQFEDWGQVEFSEEDAWAKANKHFKDFNKTQDDLVKLGIKRRTLKAKKELNL